MGSMHQERNERYQMNHKKDAYTHDVEDEEASARATCADTISVTCILIKQHAALLKYK
jgi:hypothetical protein